MIEARTEKIDVFTINTGFHYPGCDKDRSPGTRFLSAEDGLYGGECGFIWTKCEICGADGKHHYSLKNKSHDLRSVLRLLFRSGVDGIPRALL